MIYGDNRKIEEAYSSMCESDTYTRHGLPVTKQPTAADQASWIDHGSYRNRPLILTKDTPTSWAKDTETAAKLTADALAILAPIPGAGTAKVTSAVGKLAKFAQKAATAAKTVAPVAKPVATGAGKAAVAVAKPVAKTAGKAAVAVAKHALKPIGKTAATLYLGKKGIDYAVDKLKDAGNAVVDGAKDTLSKAGDMAKAHPYMTGALVAAPLVAYGAKKAYDYFKNKGKKSSTEESCNEGTVSIDESVLDGIIESMERKGYAYAGADDDSIYFDCDGQRCIFKDWNAVEEAVNGDSQDNSKSSPSSTKKSKAIDDFIARGEREKARFKELAAWNSGRNGDEWVG